MALAVSSPCRGSQAGGPSGPWEGLERKQRARENVVKVLKRQERGGRGPRPATRRWRWLFPLLFVSRIGGDGLVI